MTPPKSFTIDELGFVHLASTDVLCAVARGELDLNRVAREHLAERGLNREGKWVGFERAAELAKRLPVRGPDGRTVYVTVPEDEEEREIAYVIRENDGQYVRRFDSEHRVVVLCDTVEVAKQFQRRDLANRFRRRHAIAERLSDAALVVPIQRQRK